MVKQKRIILDTNFLMACGQFNLDIFSEIDRICHFPYSLFILDKTINELENLIKKEKGKNKQAAKLAFLLIRKKKIPLLKTKEDGVDNLLYDIADKDTIVATLDKELKKRLKGKGILTITMRQKRYLILEEK